jgi:diaminopimelate epimerase
MFWDTAEKKLTPVVFVKEVDTVYFEGSCGSGTTALAAAFSMGREDGTYSWSVPQPAGTIDVTAVVKDGRAVEISIDSPVELGLTQSVEIEV